MVELIVLLIGAVISAILALAKLAFWASLTWFWVLVPFGVAVMLILGVWCLGDGGLDF